MVDSYNSDLPSGANTNGDITWPSIKVARNGYVYALFANPTGVNGVKTGTRLNLYRSTDHGAHWTKQDVTPANAGLIRYSWMDVAGDGHTVGVGYFTHATLRGNWHLYAGISSGFGNPVRYSLVEAAQRHFHAAHVRGLRRLRLARRAGPRQGHLAAAGDGLAAAKLRGGVRPAGGQARPCRALSGTDFLLEPKTTATTGNVETRGDGRERI